MAERPIKVKDLVTLDLGEYSNSSNTYQVVAKIRGKKYVLSHPLTPECYIIRPEDELNKVAATLKNPIEKCLDFCRKHKQYLGFKIEATLDSLCYYYVIKKDLAANQKEELASINASIASILLKNDTYLAAQMVLDNQGILDAYNKLWFVKLKPCFQDISKIDTKFKSLFIYKIAGFVMAQLGETNG